MEIQECRWPLFNGLADLYNHDILPVVYTYGSLGASGDLAPLAHMSLPLLGMGDVDMKGSPDESLRSDEGDGMGSH